MRATEGSSSGLLDATARRTVRWAGVMFALVILLQRFSAPGIKVGMLLPVVLVWAFFGIRAGVIEIDRRRFLFWATAVGVTAGITVVQTWVGTAPVISMSSWALVNVVWLPAIIRFVDRRRATYERFLVVVVRVCVALALGCIAMMAVQLAGVHYHDWMKDIFPKTLLEQGFSLATPVQFGSTVYRANAWIGLEASTTSFQLGIGMLAAILTRRSLLVHAVLLVGLFATVAGSGFLLLLTGLVVIIAMPIRRILVRPLVPLLALGGALLATPYGQTLLARSDEASNTGSSASLRAIQPYSVLWPSWSSDIPTALLGGGPGSSQRLANLNPLRGLVPLPAKIFYDYGLIAGLVLAIFLLYCYVEGPSATFAFALLANLWTVQPGSNIPVFVVPVLLLVSAWAPRQEMRIEDFAPARRTPAEIYDRLRRVERRKRARTLGLMASNDARALPLTLAAAARGNGTDERPNSEL